MAAVCQKCGVTGYADLLIFCNICKTSAEHQYCLDEMADFGVVIHWACQQCKPRRFASNNKLNIDERKNARLLNHQLAPVSDVVDPCVRKQYQRIPSGVQSAQGVTWLGDITNGQEDMVLDAPNVAKGKTYSKESIGFSQKEKENKSGLLWKGDNDKKLKMNRKRLILQEEKQSSEYARDISNPLSLQTKFGFDKDKNMYRTRNIESSHHHKQLPKYNVHFVDEKPKRKRRRLILDEEDQSDDEAHISLLDKNDDTGDHQQPNKHPSTSEDYAQKATTRLTAQIIVPNEVMCRVQFSSVKTLNIQPIVQVENHDARLSMSCYSESVNWPHYFPVQPISQCIWRGCFMICNKEYGPLTAHFSTTACEKVWHVSKTLPTVVNLIKLPRLEAWPKGFETSPPSDDNIALFFFPFDMEYKWLHGLFDQLLEEVIDNDLVLKFVLEEAELLIFPSVILPKDSHRFQGQYYLWGVFKARQVVSCKVMEDEQDQQVSEYIDEGKVETCKDRLFFDVVESSRIAKERKEVEINEDSSTCDKMSKRNAVSSNGSFSSQISEGSTFLVSAGSQIPFDPRLVESSSREKKGSRQLAQDCFLREGETLEETGGEQLEVSDHSQVTEDSYAHDQELEVGRKDDDAGSDGCLNLFPVRVEDLGFISRAKYCKELNLDLGLS
ncbi:uncharacterized protein [Typha angustifolia]|uniref:uncharacterized protein n=1 Tax=Typha angustifolia TaxID=59011 RepID=UPI003C302EDD